MKKKAKMVTGVTAQDGVDDPMGLIPTA